MKITNQEKLSKSQIKLTIEILKAELVKYKEKAFKKLALEVKVEGFRQGKAPNFMIEQQVGAQKVEQELLDEALTDTYFKAVAEAKISPISRPDVKVLKFVPSDILQYEVTITLMPEIKVPDYKTLVPKIKFKPEKEKISADEIGQVLSDIQKRSAEYKPMKREAKAGDKVEIDFGATMDGKAIEGGTSQNHPLILGEKTMVPGFEEQIAGMKKNEEKEFDLEFPDDYYKKELASKKVHFKVNLKEVSEVIMPTLDDKFAQKLGKKNLDEIKQEIEKQLTEELDKKNKIDFEVKILDELSQKTQVDLPDFLIEEELKHMMQEFEQKLGTQGFKMDTYLAQIKKTEEDLKKEWRIEAEKRIKTGLLLSEIAKTEKIEVTKAETDSEVEKLVGYVEPDKKEEAKANIEKSGQLSYLRNVILNRKTIQFLSNLTKK